MLKSGDIVLKEEPKQDLQVKSFLADRYQVIIIDKTIFRFIAKGIKKEMNLKDEDFVFQYHKLFPSLTSLYVGFKDQELMKKFDKALTEMKNDGTYNKIIESYVVE
jgi:ABC-type amino acid transport substrate-binding protein